MVLPVFVALPETSASKKLAAPEGHRGKLAQPRSALQRNSSREARDNYEC